MEFLFLQEKTGFISENDRDNIKEYIIDLLVCRSTVPHMKHQLIEAIIVIASNWVEFPQKLLKYLCSDDLTVVNAILMLISCLMENCESVFAKSLMQQLGDEISRIFEKVMKTIEFKLERMAKTHWLQLYDTVILITKTTAVVLRFHSVFCGKLEEWMHAFSVIITYDCAAFSEQVNNCMQLKLINKSNLLSHMLLQYIHEFF